jgi:hypothetical protein
MKPLPPPVLHPRPLIAPPAPQLIPPKPPQLRRPAPRLPARPLAPVARRSPPLPVRSQPEVRPNPYLDFWRRYTPEGGVEFTYKDLDERLRWLILRWALWLAAMAVTAWYAFHLSPLHAPWLNIPCLVGVGFLYWLIVSKPVEIYRTMEVRPDCLLLGEDVFYRHEFELGWPSFRPDGLGNFVLAGVSGTRAVEYVTVRRFDEHDRMPEVLAAHLQAAMQQLWTAR